MIHQALAEAAADAEFFRALENRFGVPDRSHVEDTGCSAGEEFVNAGLRGNRDGVFCMCSFHWPDAVREPIQELEVIRSGDIQYKNAEIQEASVKVIGPTAILLNKIRLDAVVRGNVAINPFVVTEVYVQQNGAWKLGSLSFTRLAQ